MLVFVYFRPIFKISLPKLSCDVYDYMLHPVHDSSTYTARCFFSSGSSCMIVNQCTVQIYVAHKMHHSISHNKCTDCIIPCTMHTAHDTVCDSIPCIDHRSVKLIQCACTILTFTVHHSDINRVWFCLKSSCTILENTVHRSLTYSYRTQSWQSIQVLTTYFIYRLFG